MSDFAEIWYIDALSATARLCTPQCAVVPEIFHASNLEPKVITRGLCPIVATMLNYVSGTSLGPEQVINTKFHALVKVGSFSLKTPSGCYRPTLPTK